MCGIAGLISKRRDPVSAVRLEKMAEAIAHRGPDDQGVYTKNGVGLAHRRLSIIDLSALGHQPMQSKDGSVVMVFNGEIYNFMELRIELESFGYEFRSKTDSEVVLNAFHRWGCEAFRRFNGMFAVVFYDLKKEEIVIARDRYGIKPLYLLNQGDEIVFGSEVKAILAGLDRKPEVDKEGLIEYFTFQNFFSTKTLFKGIEILPQGSFLKFNFSTGAKQLQRYWDFSFEEPTEVISDQDYFAETDRLFRQAVQRQLVSDVDIGTYLSGGVDSGAITAIAATELPYVKSFTCGFDLNSASGMELNFDERAASEFMSYKFKTEHYEMVLKAGDMERVMPRLAYHIEEPRVGQSYPNFYAAQLASKFVKVVLSGSGGDEIFAGYPWRYYRAVVNSDFENYINKYYLFWQRLIPNSKLWKVFDPIRKETEHVWTLDIFKNVFEKPKNSLLRPEDYVNQSLYFEAKTFLHGLLVVEDKLSMAHSLETRVPFLDNDLVDFAMKVPARLKLGNLGEVVRLNENEPGPKTAKYFSQSTDGKMILRNVMSQYIPQEIISRKKQGFSAPDASWFKGDSIDYVKRELFSKDCPVYEYMDRGSVHAVLNEHFEGVSNHRLFVWSMLSLNHFLKEFIQ